MVSGLCYPLPGESLSPELLVGHAWFIENSIEYRILTWETSTSNRTVYLSHCRVNNPIPGSPFHSLLFWSVHGTVGRSLSQSRVSSRHTDKSAIIGNVSRQRLYGGSVMVSWDWASLFGGRLRCIWLQWLGHLVLLGARMAQDGRRQYTSILPSEC